MARIAYLWIYLSCLFLFAKSFGEKIPPQETDSIKKCSSNNFQFSIDLYKKVIEDEQVENVVFSPFSIGMALSMTRSGAKGNSQKQLDEALHCNEKQNIEQMFGELKEKIANTQSNFTLKTANAFFHDIDYTVIKKFSSSMDILGASAFPVNFKYQPKQSVEEINLFVSDTTDGKISDIVTDEDITEDVKLLLANTLYFKGSWKNGFNRLQSDERGFFVSHYSVVKTSFMYQRAHFNFGYIDGLKLQILEMPYEGDEVSFIMLLPDNLDLAQVEDNLNKENLTNWLSQTVKQKVDVSMPKFNISDSLHLKEHLQKMGVTDIFDFDKADLSGIAGTRDIAVGDILHKGLLEVNEDGSVATAATVVKMQSRSLNYPVRFYADHEFLWLLLHKPTNQILFMGRLTRPEGKEIHHDEL